MVARQAVPQVVTLPEVDLIAFDIPAAARYLSSTEWAIRRAIYAGKIAHKRIGKRIIIPRKILEEFATSDLRVERKRG